MQDTKYSFPSWEQIAGECRKIAAKIRAENFKPDVVLALSRGGLVPARIICDLLVIKDLISVKVDHWGITAQKDGSAKLRYPVEINLEGKRILIADDITDTGESLSLAAEWAKKRNPTEVRTAAVYHISHSKAVPDFFGEEIKKDNWVWVVWPWNLVEDMCNILPKEINIKKFSPAEAKSILERKCFAKLDDNMVQDILAALGDMLLIRQNSDGTWEKI